MIKNRNKIILFLVIICLLIGSFLLINNKDIKVKSVSSKSKKYNAVNPTDGKKVAGCDLWFEDIENQFVSYKDVVGNDQNLFIVNHCAWNPYDIASGNFSDFTEANKKSVCDMQKEFIEDKQISYSDAVNAYNASKCKGISGELTVSYDGKSCSELKKEIENDYVARYGDYLNYYVDNCKEEVGDIDKSKLKPYNTNDNDCRSLKLVNSNGELYTGILEKNGTVYGTKNQCNYSLYYLNGGAVDFKYYLENVDDNNKKAACENMRNLIENGTVNDDETRTTYDNQCLSISGQISNVETKYITFDATSGYGIECSGYAVSNGVCRYKFNVREGEVSSTTITLPDVTNTNNGNGLYELGTGRKFSYWSKNNTCSTKDILVGTGSIEINNSNYSNYEGTYYACYSDNASDTVETITDIHKTCNDANDYQATLTSTIKSTDNYTVDSTTNKYTINKYCPIKCSETFTYTYPSIFETVKSGTYFQLIYTPQVRSTYTCTETYNYALWESDYNTAIENEKKAYADYKNTETILNVNNDSSYRRKCGEDNDDDGEADYEHYLLKVDIIDKDGGTETKRHYYCTDSKTIASARNDFLSEVKQQLDDNENLSVLKNNPSKTYDEEKGKRTALEESNKFCYGTLSNVATEKFYTVKPIVKMLYEQDTTIKKDAKLTTGDPYYNDDSIDRSDEKKAFTISYGNVNETKDVYTLGTNHVVTRTKKINYEFHTDYDYYANFYTGSINSSKNGIKLGNVFPVKIASSGKRNVKFVMDTTNSTLSGNVKDVLNSGDNSTYTCAYNITNDAVVLDKETKDKTDEKDKKYKTKFYIRPVATNDVDPNNRLDKGLLGANWSSTKGQALMKIIEDKSKNKNTYNPNNLEYSFILNAESLDKIRDYNRSHKYDEKIDTYFECNGLGIECESKFLDELLKGTYGNVNGSISNGRNVRKYYIGGKWYSTDSLLSNKKFVEVSNGANYSKSEVYGVCNSSCKEDESVCYECLYRKVNEGVLP